MAGRPSLPSAMLLLLLLAISCSPLALACGSSCTKSPKSPKSSTPKSPKSSPTPPAITIPPIVVPPVTPLPSVPVIPSVPLPSIPVTPIPVIGGGGGSPAAPTGKKSGSGCPPPPAAPKKKETCPTDALKFGACLDILGSTVKIGDPSVTCCEPLEGIAGLDAALCLCTTIKEKLLNINIVLPLALQVLVNTCGKSIPSGFTCP